MLLGKLAGFVLCCEIELLKGLSIDHRKGEETHWYIPAAVAAAAALACCCSCCCCSSALLLMLLVAVTAAALAAGVAAAVALFLGHILMRCC